MTRKLTLIIISLVFLTGCLPTLPTLTPTPGPLAVPTFTPTPNMPLVTVTGDVFVRDAQDVVQGYMLKGTTVYARCVGQWCYVENSLKFWRGCSSDNPYELGCTAAK